MLSPGNNQRPRRTQRSRRCGYFRPVPAAPPSLPIPRHYPNLPRRQRPARPRLGSAGPAGLAEPVQRRPVRRARARRPVDRRCRRRRSRQRSERRAGGRGRGGARRGAPFRAALRLLGGREGRGGPVRPDADAASAVLAGARTGTRADRGRRTPATRITVARQRRTCTGFPVARPVWFASQASTALSATAPGRCMRPARRVGA